MSKSKKSRASSKTRQVTPSKPPPTISPTGKGFGTNPATSESHVSVPPEMIQNNGFLDNFQDTMFA